MEYFLVNTPFLHSKSSFLNTYNIAISKPVEQNKILFFKRTNFWYNCYNYESRVGFCRVKPHTPVAQKIAHELVFRRLKESIFFNRTSLTASDFWCASFGKYRFKPFQLSYFFWFFISRLCFESALIRNFLRTGRVRG